jgi:exosome complex component RRP4
MKRLVIPGEILAAKPFRLDDTIVENGKTCSTAIGLFDEERGTMIPLEGQWYPRFGEMVVGIVEEAKLNVYIVNLNAPYKGLIISKYAEGDIRSGDVIEASVKELDKTGTAVLTRPRVLHGGKILRIKPSKVPRVMGKGNTMVRQIQAGTKTSITLGMNGLIWLKGGDIDLAIAAINRVQNEAHVPGLTERIAKMLGVKPESINGAPEEGRHHVHQGEAQHVEEEGIQEPME